MALTEQFKNLSERIVSDFNTGQATRVSLGVKGTAFGWTGGRPNTVGDFCPTVQIAGMSVPIGTVTPSGTPVVLVAEKAPKPAAASVAIASHPAKKFAGQGRCSLEGVLEAAGLTAAITSVLGAGALATNIRLLATGGRLVVIGLQQGRRAELDLGLLLAKRASVHGTTLRSRPAAEKARIVAEVANHAWPLVGAGPAAAVQPVVHEVLPLAAASRAHALLASGEVFGKLVLVP